METITLIIPEHYPMTDDELFAFCIANKELRIERDENGQLIIMSPTGSFSGKLNFALADFSGNGQKQSVEEVIGFGHRLKGGYLLPGFELDLTKLN